MLLTPWDVRDRLPATKTCLALSIGSVHTEKPSLNLRKENIGVNIFRREDLSKSIGSFTIFTSIGISSWFYRWLLAILPNNTISPQLGRHIAKVVTHPSFFLYNMWLPSISSEWYCQFPMPLIHACLCPGSPASLTLTHTHTHTHTHPGCIPHPSFSWPLLHKAPQPPPLARFSFPPLGSTLGVALWHCHTVLPCLCVCPPHQTPSSVGTPSLSS